MLDAFESRMTDEQHTACVRESNMQRREEALRAFTLDAARAAHMDGVVARARQVGGLHLIDRDYFKIPESEIDDIQVLATYVARQRTAP